MKLRYIFALSLTLLAWTICAQVNGELSQVNDKLILKVWGTHYERGYAQGYLLADEILEVFQDYYYTMMAFSDPGHYNTLWSYYQEHFVTDPRYVAELNGMIAGMAASGTSLFHNGLERDLSVEDLELANAVVDMSQVREGSPLELGCASLASWGVSTQQDSLLAGAGVVTRLLDWSQNSALIAHPLLIVHYPSEADEIRWAAFSYPGMIGALTAVTQNHSYASLNMGNDNSVNDLTGLNPILLSIRSGLERADWNSDGTYDSDDLFDAVTASNSLSGTIIQNLAETPDYFHSSVIETNNVTTIRRLYNQNGNLPGNHIAATNSFRVITSGTCCTRYYNIQDSLYTNPNITAKRQWSVISGAAGMENNLMAIQFIPSTGYILWSTATLASPAYSLPGLVLNTDALFVHPVAVSDPTSPEVYSLILTNYPNPFNPNTTISYSVPKGGMTTLRIYNLKGQIVRTLVNAELAAGAHDVTWNGIDDQGRTVSSGLYFYRLTSSGKTLTRKMVLTK